MFEILVIIFFCVFIYKKVQRTKEEGSGSVRDSNVPPNTTVTPPPVNNNTRPPVQQASQRRPTQSMTQPRPAKTKSTQSAIQEAKEDGHSTTAYLMEKAEADAREHAKEKFEEQKRLYETRGGLAVAERYLDGDIIPQGKRCVNCGYCGAENLVPMIPKTKYSCYFCREPL